MIRIGVVACLLGLVACGGAGSGEDGEEAPERQPVETLVVEPISFTEWIETTGTVEAPQDATMSAEAAGTVIELVPEGRSVRRGQMIAQLDPGLAAAGLRQAEAAVSDARAGVAQAEDAFRRQQPLLRDSIVSPLEFEQVRAQQRQARAQLQQALAQQQEAQQRLEQSRVRAPFAGMVERHLVRVGEQVTAGQEVIRVVGPGTVEVTAGIAERFAGDVRVGAPAVVSFNAYDLGDRQARLAFVGATVDPQSRTFPIRIALPDRSGGAVKAEMIARVQVARRSFPDALVLPLEAVLRDERGESVLVVETETRSSGEAVLVVRRRPVELGARSEQGVVVQRGLQAGDEVIVLGQDDATDGDRVEVVTRHRGTPAFRAAVAQDTISGGSQ